MHRAAWVIQIVFGVYFVATGIVHFVVPEGLPGTMAWMYDLPAGLHYVSGTVEILGGLGLILPGLTKIRPELTPLAAAGLALVMVFAAAWHLPRGEYQNIVGNIVVAAAMVFVAYSAYRAPKTPEDGGNPARCVRPGRRGQRAGTGWRCCCT